MCARCGRTVPVWPAGHSAIACCPLGCIHFLLGGLALRAALLLFEALLSFSASSTFFFAVLSCPYRKRMARPVGKQFQRFGLASLHQRIRPLGVSPGQDGESRVPVLITPSACDRHIRYQVAGTPVRLSGHLVSTTHRPRQLPAPVSAAGQSQSHGFHRGSIVGAAVAKHCPHDAGQLVGQRNDDLVLVRAHHQALQPLSDGRRARR